MLTKVIFLLQNPKTPSRIQFGKERKNLTPKISGILKASRFWIFLYLDSEGVLLVLAGLFCYGFIISTLTFY